MRMFRLSSIKCVTLVALLLSISVTIMLLLMFKTNTNFYDLPEIKKSNISILISAGESLKETDPLLNPDLLKFDCEKLFDNNHEEMKRAKMYLQYHNNTFVDRFHGDYMSMDCDRIFKSRVYNSSFITDVEKDFPIAFNILFHKNVEQLERLLRSIYRRHNQYCIHVDKKTSNDIHAAVVQMISCFENVFLASKLEIVVHASVTRLTADINCMQDHIEKGFEWKYLINMAASEFPIMTNLQIVEMIQLFKGANDIHEVLSTTDDQRYKTKHFTYIDLLAKTGHVIHTNQRKEDPPHGLIITQGNAYNIFSRAYVEFAIAEESARDLLAWSADTLTPDEHYWATLNNLYSNPLLETPGGFKGLDRFNAFRPPIFSSKVKLQLE